jgi:hypothetical protein
MKRVLVFLATTVAGIGLLAGPAAAAGGLQKFNIDGTGYVWSGYGYVSGVLQCNPSSTGPTGYKVSITVTQGTSTGTGTTGAPCTGNVEHFNAELYQDGPFFPGKATVCASAQKVYDVAATGDKVSSSLCKTIKFVYAP